MNKTNIIALILAITVLLAFFTRNRIKQSVKELDYGIAPGIKFTSFDFSTSKIILPIWVYNPTNLSIIISRLNLNIFINKDFAGTVKVERSYQIKAMDKSIIPLEVELNNVQAMQVLISNQQAIKNNTWRDKIDLTVSGTAKAEAGMIYIDTVPVSISGNYKFWMG